MQLIPKLDKIRNFEKDIVFSQGDHAAEIFFITKGSVMYFFDFSEHMNMEPFVSDEKTFNMALALF